MRYTFQKWLVQNEWLSLMLQDLIWVIFNVGDPVFSSISSTLVSLNHLYVKTVFTELHNYLYLWIQTTSVLWQEYSVPPADAFETFELIKRFPLFSCSFVFGLRVSDSPSRSDSLPWAALSELYIHVWRRSKRWVIPARKQRGPQAHNKPACASVSRVPLMSTLVREEQ